MKHDEREMETKVKHADCWAEKENQNEIVANMKPNKRKGSVDNGCARTAQLCDRHYIP